jgi:uncharacterized protein YkwD
VRIIRIRAKSLAVATVLSCALATPLAGAPTVLALHALSRPSGRASSDPCPNANLLPTPANLGHVRAAVLCLVNQERVRDHESPLRANGRLQQAAQGHSEDMALGDYFEHVGPGGNTPLRRIRASGYIPSPRDGYAIGENIAWGTFSLATPQAIVAAWMASPEHRANILEARYRDTAVGVWPAAPASLAEGQSGAVYTQDFGVIVPG